MFALAGVAQWIECRLQTKGSLVQFPVRAHAWVVGQVPSRGPCERQPHIDVSLPLFLSTFSSLYVKYFFKKEVNDNAR